MKGGFCTKNNPLNWMSYDVFTNGGAVAEDIKSADMQIRKMQVSPIQQQGFVVIADNEEYSFLINNIDSAHPIINLNKPSVWCCDCNGNQIEPIYSNIFISVVDNYVLVTSFVRNQNSTYDGFGRIGIFGQNSVGATYISEVVLFTNELNERSNYFCITNSYNVEDDAIYWKKYKQFLGTDFWMKIRLISNLQNYNYTTEQEQYRQSSGKRSTRNISVYKDKTYELSFPFYNEYQTDGISSMLLRESIYINGIGLSESTAYRTTNLQQLFNEGGTAVFVENRKYIPYEQPDLNKHIFLINGSDLFEESAPAEGATFKALILATMNWRVTSVIPSWIAITPVSGGEGYTYIDILVSINTTNGTRLANIEFEDQEGYQVMVDIFQDRPKYLYVNGKQETTLEIPADGVDTNTLLTIRSSSIWSGDFEQTNAWANFAPRSGNPGVFMITTKISKNLRLVKRTARYKYTNVDGFTAYVNIVQNHAHTITINGAGSIQYNCPREGQEFILQIYATNGWNVIWGSETAGKFNISQVIGGVGTTEVILTVFSNTATADRTLQFIFQLDDVADTYATLTIYQVGSTWLLLDGSDRIGFGVNYMEHSYNIQLRSSSAWAVQGTLPSWLTLQPMFANSLDLNLGYGRNLLLTIAQNNGTLERDYSIDIRNNEGAYANIFVEQDTAQGQLFIISNGTQNEQHLSVSFDAAGVMIMFGIQSSSNYRVLSNTMQFFVPDSPSVGQTFLAGSTNLPMTITTNSTASVRTGKIEFEQYGGDLNMKASITITQSASNQILINGFELYEQTVNSNAGTTQLSVVSESAFTYVIDQGWDEQKKWFAIVRAPFSPAGSELMAVSYSQNIGAERLAIVTFTNITGATGQYRLTQQGNIDVIYINMSGQQTEIREPFYKGETIITSITTNSVTGWACVNASIESWLSLSPRSSNTGGSFVLTLVVAANNTGRARSFTFEFMANDDHSKRCRLIINQTYDPAYKTVE